jgi:hypothetical protein
MQGLLLVLRKIDLLTNWWRTSHLHLPLLSIEMILIERRCGLSGCNLAVFTWDQNINLLGSRERGVYLCSEHANFFQKDVNKFVQSHLRNQEIAEEDNLLDEMSDPDGIV